eukprot:Skav234845  [mRNA]  locus=scaffold1355:104597:104800:+ [translate_table: standard]
MQRCFSLGEFSIRGGHGEEVSIKALFQWIPENKGEVSQSLTNEDFLSGGDIFQGLQAARTSGRGEPL